MVHSQDLWLFLFVFKASLGFFTVLITGCHACDKYLPEEIYNAQALKYLDILKLQFATSLFPTTLPQQKFREFREMYLTEAMFHGECYWLCG